MPEKLKFTVPTYYDEKPAKVFFREHCKLSTRMITRLKREKDGILRNGKILRTVDKVSAGDEIIITLPQEEASFIAPIEGTLDIIYEDAHLLVLNKPCQMPVHPVKQHQTDTLANIVVYRMEQREESYVFRAVNRLDRDTSGLVMIAKDKLTANSLKNAVYKEYFALVHGEIKEGGTINAPIGLHEDSKIVRHVVEHGAPAITHYVVLNSNKEYSFLRIWLETGKTHQIRCHMSSVGYPLLGDDLYGGKRDKINRQALHCGRMRFIHPITGECIELCAPLPEDMQSIFHG